VTRPASSRAGRRPLTRAGRSPLTRAAGAALGLLLAQALLAPAAGATPLPRRPHPHRKPWPVTVTVQTVPALAGLRFGWDGQTLVTDAAGRVSVTAEHNFVMHSLSVLDQVVQSPSRRYRFVRWAGQRDPRQAFQTTVSGLPQRANYTITAGFSVQYPVTARFVDEQQRPVDPARISSATVRTGTGAIIALPVSGPVWLDGLTPFYAGSTLHARPATYSVQSVMVSGGNTVDAGQQTFRPTDQRPLVVETKFFDLTVRAHDILRGRRTGKGATVTFPDGSRRTVAFGPGGSTTLTELPRGRYTVDLDGAGSTVPSQVNLSRAAVVDVAVATRGDLVAMALAGLGLAVGLVLFGGRRRGLPRALVTSGWTRLRGLTHLRAARVGS
jgi:hypothetical protein